MVSVDASTSVLRPGQGIWILQCGCAPGRQAHHETLADTGSREDPQTHQPVFGWHASIRKGKGKRARKESSDDDSDIMIVGYIPEGQLGLSTTRH